MNAGAERGSGWRRAGFLPILAVLVASPWPYGCAAEGPRFGLAALLLGSTALWCVGRARAGSGPPALTLPALGLPALAVLQLLLGRSAAPIWTAEALLVLLAMVAAFLVASEEARAHEGARQLATAILVACGAQAAFGAWQWSAAPTRIYGQATAIVTAPFGSYVNHNHFAGLLEMGVLLAAGLCAGLVRSGARRSARAVLAAGLTLGLTAAHLASRSRGGLVALVLGFALLVLLGAARGSGPRRAAMAFAALGAATLGFGLLAIPAATRQHLGTLLSGPRDSSGSYRMDAALAAVRTWGSAPLLGTGLGAFADAVPAFKRSHGNVRTTHAESDVLELAAEAGLVGLGLVSVLAVALGRRLGERLELGRDALRNGLTLGAAAGAGALVVHSCFDFNLRLPANALVFAAVAALCAAPHSGEPHAAKPRRSILAFAAALALLAAIAAWRAQGAFALETAMARPASERLAALDVLLERHPYLAEGFRARASAWSRLAHGPDARLARAERDLVSALERRPRWAEALADRAWIRLARGEATEAARDFDAAVALDPSHRGISLARAEFLARTQGLDAARGEIRRLQDADRSWSETEARALATRLSAGYPKGQ